MIGDDSTTAFRRTRSKAPPSSGQSAARPRLLFFHRTTDGPSRRVDGLLAYVLQRNRNHERFVVYRIDVDERPDLAERLRVWELPTLLVVDDRRIVARLVKPRSSEEIRSALADWLRQAGKTKPAASC